MNNPYRIDHLLLLKGYLSCLLAFHIGHHRSPLWISHCQMNLPFFQLKLLFDFFGYHLFFVKLKFFLYCFVILFSNFILIIFSKVQILICFFTNLIVFLLSSFLLIQYLFLNQGPDYMKNQYFNQLNFILLKI